MNSYQNIIFKDKIGIYLYVNLYFFLPKFLKAMITFPGVQFGEKMVLNYNLN